jgi:putative transposase
MTEWLRRDKKYEVNPKRVRRLMKLMGLYAIYPKARLSEPGQGDKVYPYLIGNVTVTRSNHVWSVDITYIRLRGGFIYLAAIIDWFSRFVVSWEISNSQESDFCISALNRALIKAKPEIFNGDQGVQL